MTSKDALLYVVCGGGVEYEFLLGSLREHVALFGRVLVYDVSPPQERRRFHRIPDSVAWVVAEKDYRSGDWKSFRVRTAVIDAYTLGLKMARSLGLRVMVRVDSDEYYTADIDRALAPLGTGSGLEHYIVHYAEDWTARYKPGGYARRIWGVDAHVEMPENSAWRRCPDYNGNPERHMIPVWRGATQVTRTDLLFHYHLHYAFPQHKGGIGAFGGWVLCPAAPLPPLIDRWRTTGVPPSEDFQ